LTALSVSLNYLLMIGDLKTSATQLRNLQCRGSDSDWESFYEKYAGVILSFCRNQGIDDFSARDVLQETMILLMRKLPVFEYSSDRGRFRNWLLTLVYGKIRDARRRLRRLAELPLSEIPPAESEAVAVRYGTEVDEDVEIAWKQALIEEGLRRVKQNTRLKPETLALFETCVIKNMSIPDAARKFQLQENNIYQIKNRLLRMVREEVEHLEKNQPGGSSAPFRDDGS